MTPSKAQVDTVARLVKQLEVDERLNVRVTLHGNDQLLVRTVDRWEIAACIVARNGDCEALEVGVGVAS